MLLKSLAVTALLSTAFGASIGQHPKKDLTLAQSLELAPTQTERIKILTSHGGNSSFKFSFNNPPAAAVAESTASGSVVAAVGASFPPLLGLDAGLIKFSLGPCGMIVPHLHPRADEFIVVVNGTIVTQFLTESGSSIITNRLAPFDATIFPKGSFHFELNPTCENAVFMGFFNSNDPGTSLIAPNFFSLDKSAVLAQIGGVVSGADVASIEKNLPAGPVAAVEQCLRKCGIQKNAKRSLSELVSYAG